MAQWVTPDKFVGFADDVRSYGPKVAADLG